MFEYFGALAAGFLSFLSPCVLPLLPSYLAMLAAGAVWEGKNRPEQEAADKAEPAEKNKNFLRSLAFVLGFTVVFVSFGVIFSQASALIGGPSRTWTILAGSLIVLLGINILFDIFSFLNFEKRFHFSRKPASLFSAFLFGLSFGAGWSPCVGPMLASILFLAGSGSWFKAAALLCFYSLGLGAPFLLGGLFFSRLEGIFRGLKKRAGLIKIISGAFLIIMGAAMILGNFNALSGAAVRGGYELQALMEARPAVIRIGTTVFFCIPCFLFLASLFKKNSPKKAGPVLGALIFGILALLEGLGLVSGLKLLASWLLFRGV
jgi:cytochrome c-type biogenesis protein